MRHFTPFFEKDGSYNERHHEKPKPRPPELGLFFDRPIAVQLEDVVSICDGVRLDEMREAMNTLVAAGCLPGNRARAVEKQITMAAERFIRNYAKAL